MPNKFCYIDHQSLSQDNKSVILVHVQIGPFCHIFQAGKHFKDKFRKGPRKNFWLIFIAYFIVFSFYLLFDFLFYFIYCLIFFIVWFFYLIFYLIYLIFYLIIFHFKIWLTFSLQCTSNLPSKSFPHLLGSKGGG